MRFKLWSRRPKDIPVNNQVKTPIESEAIAAPKIKPYPSPSPTFIPIDVVVPLQTIPGKFNYTSSTWKYLQNYFIERIEILSKSNENTNLTIEKTQVIRGQLKEIKRLLNHTNQLAGIPNPPKKMLLSNLPTGQGNSYE